MKGKGAPRRLASSILNKKLLENQQGQPELRLFLTATAQRASNSHPNPRTGKTGSKPESYDFF